MRFILDATGRDTEVMHDLLAHTCALVSIRAQSAKRNQRNHYERGIISIYEYTTWIQHKCAAIISSYGVWEYPMSLLFSSWKPIRKCKHVSDYRDRHRAHRMCFYIVQVHRCVRMMCICKTCQHRPDGQTLFYDYLIDWHLKAWMIQYFCCIYEENI